MISSRKLDDLLPQVKVKAQAFIAKCKEHGIDILITSTFRDIESQNALYSQGRTTAGRIVTNAKGGHSYHNYKCAFDFVPLINGKPNWNDLATFNACGQIGKSVGLEWAGDWISFKELAHFQDTGGLTIKDLLAGKKPFQTH